MESMSSDPWRQSTERCADLNNMPKKFTVAVAVLWTPYRSLFDNLALSLLAAFSAIANISSTVVQPVLTSTLPVHNFGRPLLSRHGHFKLDMFDYQLIHTSGAFSAQESSVISLSISATGPEHISSPKQT
jgi:hypothetical protein